MVIWVPFLKMRTATKFGNTFHWNSEYFTLKSELFGEICSMFSSIAYVLFTFVSI